jgi:transcriptional regulator with XRE-family HTH domain
MEKFSQAECFQAGIRAFRDHGWMREKQKDLSKRIGYTPTHISQVFKGKRSPSLDLMEKMSIEFGLNAEDVIRVGRSILERKGFFPFYGQIDDLPSNSEAQARRIVKLTNRAFGIEGHLLSYRPALWDEFIAGKISASEFYDGYSKELQELIDALKANIPGKQG